MGSQVRSTGFTLLELLIVVAVLGILTAVSVSAYSEYVNNSRMAKVNTHYAQAQRSIKWNFARAEAQLSRGQLPNPPLPTTAAGWFPHLDQNDTSAPGGGPAFVVGPGDPVTGAVGVAMSGDVAAKTAVVTITRPAFFGLAARSVAIGQLDL